MLDMLKSILYYYTVECMCSINCTDDDIYYYLYLVTVIAI